jgi:hypothetical protein
MKRKKWKKIHLISIKREEKAEKMKENFQMTEIVAVILGDF